MMPIRRVPKDDVRRSADAAAGEQPAPQTAPDEVRATASTARPAPVVADAGPLKHTNKPAGKKPKNQLSGDYAVGWCRPPAEHQFKGRPGPGRPKGSVSQDKLLRKHLELKRKVKVDGTEKNITTMELMVMTVIKRALEGKKELSVALAESLRLFPGEQSDNESGGGPSALSAADQQTLAEFFSNLGLDPVPARGTTSASVAAEEEQT